MNSYAYMLLVGYFLQKKRVLPNLQKLGKEYKDPPSWVQGDGIGEAWYLYLRVPFFE